MAKIFSTLPGMKQLIAYWYHFVIMFEALFILTLLETGTRVARFIFQETVTQFPPNDHASRASTNWALNVTMSVGVCLLWGYLLYTGNIDRLWRMMGIANQLLAAIALAVGTTYLLKCSPKRIYALCTGIPFVFVVATVFTAGVLSIQSWSAELADLQSQLASLAGESQGVQELATKVFSLKLMRMLAGIMLVLSAVIIVDAVRKWYGILASEPQPAVQPAAVEATE